MKTKAIQVKSEIHSQIKQHCDEKGLKLQALVEKLIVKYLENEKGN